jgi:hypothetical protein
MKHYSSSFFSLISYISNFPFVFTSSSFPSHPPSSPLSLFPLSLSPLSFFLPFFLSLVLRLGSFPQASPMTCPMTWQKGGGAARRGSSTTRMRRGQS